MEKLSNSKKLLYGALGGVLILAAIYTSTNSGKQEGNQNDTIAYTEHSSKENAISQFKITQEQLEHWDSIANELLDKTPLEGGGSNRLYAYLYNAQKAFADASLAKSDSYLGSIDPISVRILQLFYPNYNNEKVASDPYSEALTNQVFHKFQSRFQNEKAKIKPVNVHLSKDTWQGKQPYVGIIYPSFQTWSVADSQALACIAPPAQDDPIWLDQLALVEEVMSKTTPVEKQKIIYWAGMLPKGSGDFKDIANEYMKENNVPLKKQLEVRSTLASAESDAMVAVFSCKYKYLIKRPDMLDDTLKTIIDTPNHPSYPAGHSVVSRTSAKVLNYYFPENKDQWDFMCEECGLSRIWAGVHFPLDHLGGLELGTKVAETAIENQKNYTLLND